MLGYVNKAKELLADALQLCNNAFQNAGELQEAVKEVINLLGRQWYEAVTPKELATIEHAMVNGSRGIATHSGHWYNCFNGVISLRKFVPARSRPSLSRQPLSPVSDPCWLH